MVNNSSNSLRARPVQLAPDPFPADRALLKTAGPIYDLALVQSHIVETDAIRLFTPDCDQDVLNMSWDVSHVLSLLQCLTVTDYHESEWCKTGKGLSIDCDAYIVKFDGVNRTPTAKEIYFKFGFRPNYLLLLAISCHTALYPK